MPRWSIRPSWSSAKASHGSSTGMGPVDSPPLALRLVHRDAAELLFESLHGVEHCGGPIAETGVQTSAAGDQQRKAGAGLFVADADVTFFVERHAISPCLVESRISLRLTGASAI